MKKRPIAIDLFSGCGGFSLGIEAAGFDVACAIDNDPIHCLVHHYNFPYSIQICQDIFSITGKSIIEKISASGFKPEVDLVIGSPPCQGFSVMGRQKLNDPRNSLIFEYLRLIEELQPKYFLFENVPNLGSVKYQELLQPLLNSFNEIGYQVVQPIQLLNGASYGASQHRKRLFLLGYRNDADILEYPPPTHLRFNNEFTNATVESVLFDLAKIPIYTKTDKGLNKALLSYKNDNLTYCHKRMGNEKVYGHLGSVHKKESIERFKISASGKTEPISRFFKLSPNGLCHTLRAGTGTDKGSHTAPRPIHYEQARCITIREAARLHTFPDWFQFHRTIWHGFREIGNAVIPLVGKALGDMVMSKLDINQNELEIKELKPFDADILEFNHKQAISFYLDIKNKKRL